jgi:hypothetical protein
MKSSKVFASLTCIAFVLLTPAFLSGCASRPGVDWTARLGEMTYDQAVLELGPPSRQAKLADGKIVADWVTRSQVQPTYGFGVGGYRSRTGIGLGTSVGGGFYERVLRLTFGKDGKLENWHQD